MIKLAEIEVIEDLNKRHEMMQQWGQDRGFNHSYPGLNVMRYIERLEAALEPFKSGEWGAWKVWLVEGAPTREEGILAAKTITKYQCRVDEVLSQPEREEATHDHAE